MNHTVATSAQHSAPRLSLEMPRRNADGGIQQIDNNLSQNPLIRDCKTLVRRDRNEEASLVSYIVPELKRWPEWLETRDLQDVEEEGTDIGPTKVYFKRFRPIQTEVRDYLQGLLPWYAVPTVFIVLNKLPLNVSPTNSFMSKNSTRRKFSRKSAPEHYSRPLLCFAITQRN